MQGWRSISALLWAPEKANVRLPLRILFPFVVDHFSFCPVLGVRDPDNARVTHQCCPLLDPREGRGEAATSDFALFVGEP